MTQSSRFIALYKLAAGQIIKRMYNCPGQMFTNLDEANAWLQNQLEKLCQERQQSEKGGEIHVDRSHARITYV